LNGADPASGRSGVSLGNASRPRADAELPRDHPRGRPGDVVIDVGTGTGILAAAAAQAGASRVYALEVGHVSRLAERLFEANGVADRITLVHGLSTSVRLPERAGVLVSELIGDEPLGEGVLGITKDALWRLLKPNARLVPSGIRLLGLPVTLPERDLEKLVFRPDELVRWKRYYQLDFEPLGGLREPPLLRHFVNAYSMRDWIMLAPPLRLVDIDVRSQWRPWIWTRQRATALSSGELNGFAICFELKVGSTVFFSTCPHCVAEDNHWQSPVQVFDRPLQVLAGDRLEIIYWQAIRRAVSGCHIRRVR
jgi:hypothetical protein